MEVEGQVNAWDGMKREGQEWAEHLVPDENLGELPSGESGI